MEMNYGTARSILAIDLREIQTTNIDIIVSAELYCLFVDSFHIVIAGDMSVSHHQGV